MQQSTAEEVQSALQLTTTRHRSPSDPSCTLLMLHLTKFAGSCSSLAMTSCTHAAPMGNCMLSSSHTSTHKLVITLFSKISPGTIT